MSNQKPTKPHETALTLAGFTGFFAAIFVGSAAMKGQAWALPFRQFTLWVMHFLPEKYHHLIFSLEIVWMAVFGFMVTLIAMYPANKLSIWMAKSDSQYGGELAKKITDHKQPEETKRPTEPSNEDLIKHFGGKK